MTYQVEKRQGAGNTGNNVADFVRRAQESKKDDRHIYDEKAIEIVSELDYDFSKAADDKMMSYGVIARTILLDRLVEDFLKQNKDAVVINIACGLDTRCYRMQGKYLRWYNVDLPETMQIRSRFLEENGPDLSDRQVCDGPGFCRKYRISW